MKSVKLVTLITALMVIVVFTNSSTTDNAAKDISLKSTAKVETQEVL